MNMCVRIGLVLSLGVIPAIAHADHHGMAMQSSASPESTFGVGLSLVAASFSTDYIGDYEALVPSLGWAMGRFSAGASIGLYRLDENGRKFYGLGDAVVHGQATLVIRESVQGGVMLAVSAPTGDSQIGLGMGHVMAMPALWGTWNHDRLTLAVSGGVGRALASIGHVHGMWPLVEPMNISEVTWSASGEITVTRDLHAGLRVGGGAPVIDPGINRIVAALRVAWVSGRVDTAAELQAGLAGDPFTFRGVVDTSVHF
ncbi:MAG: uncharacterized protein JWO36_4486 [Myxococcales bacterium]|nr:uncharacterized protein [Myxococcales bacterium]